MAHPTIIINGVIYQACPEVDVPKQGGGTAKYVDTDDATLNGGDKMLDGFTGYSQGVKYTGSIPTKAAQTYTPTTSDQTIQSGQYLGGSQIVKGDANLTGQNIRAGVNIFGVDGEMSVPTIVQNPTTKVVTIS